MTTPEHSQTKRPSAEAPSRRAVWGLAAASLFIALAGVELILYAAGFSFPLYPKKIEFGWPDPISIENLYRPDNDLLWVQKDYSERLATLQKQHPDIIFMGDSCTEFGTYDAFFSARLKEHGYEALTAAKLGAGGYSSYQGMQQFTRDVVPLHPAVVTIYFGWNDHWLGFGIEDKRIGKLRSPLLSLLENSRLIQLLVKAYFVITRGLHHMNPLRVSESDFRDNLRRIVATAKASGIIPVLLTAPTSHQRGKEPAYLKLRHLKDLDQLVPLHQRYVSIVREVAAETGAPLCDLEKDFAALPPEDLAKYFIKDGIHLTKETGEGYDRLASFLFACFERANLLHDIH